MSSIDRQKYEEHKERTIKAFRGEIPRSSERWAETEAGNRVKMFTARHDILTCAPKSHILIEDKKLRRYTLYHVPALFELPLDAVLRYIDSLELEKRGC